MSISSAPRYETTQEGVFKFVPDDDLGRAAKRLNIPLWGRLLIWVLGILVMSTAGALSYGFVRMNNADTANALQLKGIRDSIQVLAEKTPDRDLINRLLSQARKEGDAAIDNKLTSVEERLKSLDASNKTAIREQEALKRKVEQQQSLMRIDNPDRILAVIRGEIQIAEANPSRQIPLTRLLDYKNAVRGLSTSASDYWHTVAALVNYQSYVNQIAGNAPDPSTVASPCFGMTAQNGVANNMFANGSATGCVVDLDRSNSAFVNFAFLNSVIRYHGGPTFLQNVTFVNCRFLLDLPIDAKPTQPKLILAILDSPDQLSVKVPAS